MHNLIQYFITKNVKLFQVGKEKRYMKVSRITGFTHLSI